MSHRLEQFRRRAASVMDDVPLAVAPTTPCREVVAAMTARGAGCALIVAEDGALAGIVTDQDVTRRLAYQTPPDTPIAAVMTTPVVTIARDDPLFRGVAMMHRRGIRHLPVVEADGRPVGLVDRLAATAAIAAPLLDRIGRLGGDDSLDGLRTVRATAVALAADLIDDGVAAIEVQRLLADLNRDLYRRVVAGAVAAMAAAGRGRPPVRFDVLGMGSGGRGETFLSPDQDNGMILADYPDEDHAEIDAWFIELAERMTRTLDAIGMPLCRGNVMATNPLWRKTLGQWCAQTAAWSRRRSFLAARLVGIVLDFQAAAGEGRLTAALRDHIARQVGRSRGFLRELYLSETDAAPALGWFNRLLVETDDPDHRGEINLKYRGTLPMVDAVRLLALQAGVTATSTLGRLAGLKASGVMTDAQHDELARAFALITERLLKSQITAHRAGRPPSAFVDPRRLSLRERRALVQALAAVDRLRARLRAEFSADVF